MPRLRPRAILTDDDVPQWDDPNANGAVGGVGNADANNPVANYFSRLVAYIPAETITVYQAVESYVQDEPAASANPKLLVVGLLLLVLTPIWVAVMTKDRTDTLATHQIVISTLAFFVWLLASANPIVNWISDAFRFEWDGDYGAIALVVSGIFIFPLIEQAFRKWGHKGALQGQG